MSDFGTTMIVADKRAVKFLNKVELPRFLRDPIVIPKGSIGTIVGETFDPQAKTVMVKTNFLDSKGQMREIKIRVKQEDIDRMVPQSAQK